MGADEVRGYGSVEAPDRDLGLAGGPREGRQGGPQRERNFRARAHDRLLAQSEHERPDHDGREHRCGGRQVVELAEQRPARQLDRRGLTRSMAIANRESEFREHYADRMSDISDDAQLGALVADLRATLGEAAVRSRDHYVGEYALEFKLSRLRYGFEWLLMKLPTRLVLRMFAAAVIRERANMSERD